MRLRYTQPALGDLNEILDYLRERSPQGALRVHRRVDQVMNLLVLHPLSGKLTEDPTIRRQIVPPYPYLIFYEVGDDEIIVHAVRHSSRNPRTMPGSENG